MIQQGQSEPTNHVAILLVVSLSGIFLLSFFALEATAQSGTIAIDIRVTSGTDDAEERSSGSMYLTSSDLELVYDRSDQTIGIRFNTIDIPQGSTITNAHIQFTVDEKDTITTTLTIQGHNTNNAPTFTSTAYDISTRPRTTATTNWNPAPWNTVGEAGPDQQTPDITTIIQEIINKPDWTTGNSLAIIITGTGERTAESYNGDRNNAPLLTITYE